MPYGGLDRFATKQLGSILDDVSKWPGGIAVYYAAVTTAIAPVAAMPTTAAHASLWNSDKTSKKLVILAAGTIITTSAGAAINLGLAAHETTVAVTSMAGTAASTITPLTSVATAYSGVAQFKSAVTIVNNGLWHAIAPTVICANTANLMLTTEADLAGRYVIEPGMQFSLASLCNAAGSAVCTPWVIWAEVNFVV